MKIEQQIENFRSNFCPFGYLDIKRAIEIANEVEENENWLYEEMERWADDTETKISDIDPVYIAYEVVLQEARNQINQLTDYDFINDAKEGEIYTYGNYCGSSYDWPQSAVEELQKVLKKKKIKLNDLNAKTKWFLDQLEIKLK